MMALKKLKWVDRLSKLLAAEKFGSEEQRYKARELLKKMARVADRKVKCRK